MSETPAEYVTNALAHYRFTKYEVIADGKVLLEETDWITAYWFFLDHRAMPGVKNLALVIKRREIPEGGQYKDIEW